MYKSLKKEVQEYYNHHKDIKLVCKKFKNCVYPDTLKRWCNTELAEQARQRSKEYHNKMKTNDEYKENRKQVSRLYRKTERYKKNWQKRYDAKKEKYKQYAKQHRDNNIEHYNKLAKKNYLQNKEKYKKTARIYYENNKQRLHNIELKRYHNDYITNLKHNIRISLNRALKYGGTKNNKAVKYLGCTIEEFKNYLEQKFEEGMSFENRDQWHIDHIIPLVKLKDGYTLEQLCHYTNLQPLWKADNLAKSAKVY